PVLAELLFPAHGLLLFAQPCLMLTKTIPWSIERPIGKGGQADHPHVDAHSCGRSMDWRFHLALCLNRHQPSAPARLTVTYLTAPSTSRLLRYRTQPSLGSQMRLLFCSRQVPCG